MVGESGYGKTTASRAILRLLPVAGGSISYQDIEVLSLSGKGLRAFRKKVQIIFQDPCVRTRQLQAELKKIKVRLGHLNKETALTTLGRICLGIVQALLLPIALAFDILQCIPIAGPPIPVTPGIWRLQDTIFQAPEHPGVAMIASFCDRAQELINQQKQEEQQQHIVNMTV